MGSAATVQSGTAFSFGSTAWVSANESEESTLSLPPLPPHPERERRTAHARDSDFGSERLTLDQSSLSRLLIIR
ncbi:hypothetical protein JCM4814A_31730 [Streptomyces phaeofaciens JCM 4814]|uniref:Uncharacterized protein n=1 Tax=Streptomyces phaeofaciens TaxID=68254 RepID=A0A918HJV0_9ACTN|nr:hypothetical protein GCM10010226_50550 [Streptomyces phaeofaciens]